MKKLVELIGWNKFIAKLVAIKILKSTKITKVMSKFKFKISSDVIRRANTRTISKGVAYNPKSSSNGITTTVFINGVEVVREISRERIKEAYSKSIKDYAKKL